MVLQQMCGGSKWCINFSCESSWWKEGSFYWLTEKGQSGGTAPPGPPKMEWYFVWRNQNKASKRSQWGTWTQLHYRQEEEEKKKQKERSRRRESQRDQVWHSACHLAHFPLGSYFALPVEDSWRVHLQKQLSLIFPKSCFFFFFNCALQGLSIKPVF